MLFINPDPTHVVIRTEIKPLYDTRGNMVQPKQRRVFVKFKRGIAPAWAQQIGTQTFELRNRPPEVEAGHWLAAYDSASDEWDADERAYIETRLVEMGYLAVEPEKITAPYPMYDQHRLIHGQRKVEHAIKDIVATYELAGFDVEHAVVYERQEGNDPQVIAALQALGAPDGGDEADALIAA